MPTTSLLLTLAATAGGGGGGGGGDWISKLIDSQAFAAVAGLAVAVLGYLYLRNLGKKKPKPASRVTGGDPLADRGRRQSLAQERAAERDMQGVAVEFAERVREMTGQIDTRLAKLEVLINEADAKIAKLQVLRGDAAEPREIGREPEPIGNLELPPAGKGLGVGGPLDRHQDVYELADAGHDHDEIARQLGRPRGEVDLILALRP